MRGTLMKSCSACLLGLGCCLTLGVLIPLLAPSIEQSWHYRKMSWKFSKQIDSSGMYQSMPYADLEALLRGPFTVGDAYAYFGKPQYKNHPYQSKIDEFNYIDYERMWTNNEIENGLVSSVELVFTNDILKEWWPVEIDAVLIRGLDGKWTAKGIEIRAWEKWPGTKISESTWSIPLPPPPESPKIP